MPQSRPLGDVLHEYFEAKKTGALFVAVKEKSENLIRIFFKNGEIRHMSYGECSGRDCLDIVDCYSFSTAYFVNNMQATAVSEGLPPTNRIIEVFRKTGKEVLMQ